MKQIICIISFIACTLCASAQVFVESKIDSIEILIGEQTDITLSVTAPKGSNVKLPSYKPSQNITPGVEVLGNSNADTSQLDNGLVLYTFRGYDDVSAANQIVNVLEVNLSDPRYSIKFAYADKGEINSNMVKNEPAAIAGINGGYEQEAIYIKINNAIISQVSLQPGHLRYWKHEACIFSEGERTVGILYGGKDGEKAIEAYNSLEASNIIASAPMLINDYDPIGEDFIGGTFTDEQLNQFDYEDYRRQMGDGAGQPKG